MILIAFYLLIACVFPDILINCDVISKKNKYIFAIFDNLTHGIIAFFSWIYYREAESHLHEIWSFSLIMEALLCAFFSCIIDIDHFICAKSFNIKTVLDYRQDLYGRPFLHNSALIPFIAILLFILLKWLKFMPKLLPKNYGILYLLCNAIEFLIPCLIIAMATHHIRDAIRRGTFATTPPVVNRDNNK
ncbi:unnamed protein product [Gordionus sp. m RMFG-2023]